jgi:hypothetical protein
MFNQFEVVLGIAAFDVVHDACHQIIDACFFCWEGHGGVKVEVKF